MKSNGKAKIGMLLLDKKGKLEIVEPDRFYDGKGIPNVITQRWLEDEKGQKQAIYQEFGFSMQQEQVNQKQVSELDGHPVYTYLKTTYPSSADTAVHVGAYSSTDVKINSLTKDAVTNVDVSCGATYGATLIKNLVLAALNDGREA